MKLRFQALVLALLPALLGGVGCNRIRARTAFKDGNRFYREENFKQAIERYQRATELNPNMPEAWFYLGSANHGLYRPGKDTPENKQRLQEAVNDYTKALEVLDAGPVKDYLKKVRNDALGALVGIYADEPFKDYEKAQKYADRLVKENPDDPKNLFAMANLYEKFTKVDEAEGMYKRAFEGAPQGKTDAEKLEAKEKACGALAAFYNKPLWEGRSKFDQAIEILDQCAALNPKDEKGYYKVATFFWDKAFRDPLLTDKEKDQYADKGLEAVDKALKVKPDYVEALIYKGLLYRVKAQVTTNPRLRQQYLDEAATLQKQAVQMKKDQVTAAAPTPAPSSN
jgi:tetratricopeptide (TPR) repeat protein